MDGEWSVGLLSGTSEWLYLRRLSAKFQGNLWRLCVCVWIERKAG